MNEILASFYYCFSEYESNLFAKKNVEIDAFFCFCNLMADLKEGFMRDDDEGNNGINKRVEVLNKLFKKIDYTL